MIANKKIEGCFFNKNLLSYLASSQNMAKSSCGASPL